MLKLSLNFMFDVQTIYELPFRASEFDLMQRFCCKLYTEMK